MTQADGTGRGGEPAGTSQAPRLDGPVDHGVGPWSLTSLIGGYITELDDLAASMEDDDPDGAARRRAFAAGMMLAYSLAVRPVIDQESATRSLRRLIDDDGWSYEEALAQVLADVEEHREYWHVKHGYLERYRRLTAAQGRRPEVKDLPWQRAACLALEYRKGTGPDGKRWTVRALAREIGLSHSRVGQMLDSAGVQPDQPDR